MSRSRGFTLIEMLVVMSVGSVLLVLGMRSIHRAMDIASHARIQAQQEQTALRLSRQFRQDVHRSEGFAILADEKEKPILRLSISKNHVVQYQQEKDTLLRDETIADEHHYETFVLPEEGHIKISELQNPTRVSLEIESETGVVVAPTRLFLHAEAALGVQSFVVDAEGQP